MSKRLRNYVVIIKYHEGPGNVIRELRAADHEEAKRQAWAECPDYDGIKRVTLLRIDWAEDIPFDSWEAEQAVDEERMEYERLKAIYGEE